MIGAGDLQHRYHFQKRADLSGNSPPGDGYGNMEGAWATQFTYNAHRLMLRGGEQVMAARLAGNQPAIITVYSTIETRTMTTAWRAEDARTGEIWNIRSISPTEDRRWLELLCERGVTT